ncbi:ParB N-terminal domain-containing protein [Megasphaera sp. CLA-AA-H81]|uniref:ParB N-terminal domain-containing protein n=1 Tax=Megasphaera intestinihominis TaxID=3133159 RepID=A0ABV1CVT9_9FIRM
MANKKQMEAYEIKKIKRSQIKLAAYNPRTITDEARKRLKKGLKKFGLVQPLVWNETTGVLVSGHQRLSILDETYKYPDNDYTLTVSVVHLSEKDEKILNVQLNNQSMMGEFDYDALRDMQFEAPDLDQLGFSDSDLDIVFRENGGEIGKLVADSEEAEETKDKLDEIKDERKQMNKQKDAENSAYFYFTVICEDEAQRTALMKKMGVPIYEEFVTADKLKKL